MKTEQVTSSRRTLSCTYSTEDGELVDVSQPGVVAIGISNPQVAELFAFALHRARVPLRADHVPPMASPLLQQPVGGQTIFVIADRDVPVGVDVFLLLDSARRLLWAIEGSKPGSSLSDLLDASVAAERDAARAQVARLGAALRSLFVRTDDNPHMDGQFRFRPLDSGYGCVLSTARYTELLALASGTDTEQPETP